MLFFSWADKTTKEQVPGEVSLSPANDEEVPPPEPQTNGLLEQEDEESPIADSSNLEEKLVDVNGKLTPELEETEELIPPPVAVGNLGDDDATIPVVPQDQTSPEVSDHPAEPLAGEDAVDLIADVGTEDASPELVVADIHGPGAQKKKEEERSEQQSPDQASVEESPEEPPVSTHTEPNSEIEEPPVQLKELQSDTQLLEEDIDKNLPTPEDTDLVAEAGPPSPEAEPLAPLQPEDTPPVPLNLAAAAEEAKDLSGNNNQSPEPSPAVAEPKKKAGVKKAAPGARPKVPGDTVKKSPAATKPSASTMSKAKTSTGRATEAKSKIGSTDNIRHTPGGGNVRIVNAKPSVAKVQSKVGSLDYAAHSPGGGKTKIEDRKLDFKASAQPKVPARENIHHKPGGGEKKVETQKLVWKAESKVGSLDKAAHKPAGGGAKVASQKLEWKAQSKVGSLENAAHKPTPPRKKVESQKLDFGTRATSKIGSLENADRKPAGGVKKVQSQKLEWNAKSKVGSLENATHKATGGNVKITEQKVEVKGKSKVGSLENVKHKAGGGQVKVFEDKLEFHKKVGSRKSGDSAPGTPGAPE